MAGASSDHLSLTECFFDQEDCNNTSDDPDDDPDDPDKFLIGTWIILLIDREKLSVA